MRLKSDKVSKYSKSRSCTSSKAKQTDTEVVPLHRTRVIRIFAMSTSGISSNRLDWSCLEFLGFCFKLGGKSIFMSFLEMHTMSDRPQAIQSIEDIALLEGWSVGKDWNAKRNRVFQTFRKPGTSNLNNLKHFKHWECVKHHSLNVNWYKLQVIRFTF